MELTTQTAEPSTVPLDKLNFEISMIQSLTKDVSSWLDVACGTGVILEQACGHPDVMCTGIDMSLPLLEAASTKSPEARFICADFADPSVVRQSHYDFVTLLGFAYALQESEYDISILVRNLYLWAKPGGVVFMSVIDPGSDTCMQLPPTGEEYEEIGFTGEDGDYYSVRKPEDSERMNLVTPPIGWVLKLFRSMFTDVKLIDYPEEYPMMKGILATKPGGVYATTYRSGVSI